MKRLIPLFMLIAAACQAGKPSPTASPIQEAIVPPTSTLVLPTSAPTLPQTAEPYEAYTIDSLRNRTYGGGNIEVTQLVATTDSFTRYLIRYPSDGLDIHGFANVPKGEGPFPVIVAIHGYVDPQIYETLDYTTDALDNIAQAGYIVIHPNLRGYPPSANGDILFRVGFAIDVLNLIALVKSQSGPAELFGTAAPETIGLWGHSMGGSIALRVLTVSPDVDAAVLFASMSGDELKNAELLSKFSPDPVLQAELAAPPAVLERVSPKHYYDRITAPIQLHHGGVDQTVPLAWAEETCNAMTALRIEIECLYYPTEDHTFRSRVADQLYSAVFRFYDTHLSP